MDHSKDYEDGLAAGRLISLERTVSELASDMKQMKAAIYMLYGAIALVQFLPEIAELWRG